MEKKSYPIMMGSACAQRILMLWNKRNKIKKGSTSNKESKKESNKKEVACHYYKQPGYCKSECPLLQRKKESKKSNKKRLLSIWEDLENDLTLGEEVDKEEDATHLCFISFIIFLSLISLINS